MNIYIREFICVIINKEYFEGTNMFKKKHLFHYNTIFYYR